MDTKRRGQLNRPEALIDCQDKTLGGGGRMLTREVVRPCMVGNNTNHGASNPNVRTISKIEGETESGGF